MGFLLVTRHQLTFSSFLPPKVVTCTYTCLVLLSFLPAVFENKDKIVIVMEYASKGELYDYISERRRLNERETRHFFRQIVSAVHYCHKVRLASNL